MEIIIKFDKNKSTNVAYKLQIVIFGAFFARHDGKTFANFGDGSETAAQRIIPADVLTLPTSWDTLDKDTVF